jgi:diguanylate cyclase (GGDEF)-like protein
MNEALACAARPLVSRVRAAACWPIWSLPRWLAVFVIAVVATDLAAIGAAAPAATFSRRDLALCGVLMGCTVAAVEITRRAGEQGGLMKDVQGVWELPAAILLPPFYALIVPVAQTALTQWRVRRAPVHRRVFTGAAVGLSYGAASVTFHGLSGQFAGSSGAGLRLGLGWTTLVTLSALVKWALNKVLVLTAVKGANRSADVRKAFFGGEPLYNDAAEICIAVMVTFSAAGELLLAFAALPVVTLLQRSLSHVQLVSESRNDSKTGLLNSATWEREATAEITRAVRTRTPLAIAMVDIDKFKVINDTYGHLVGDQALKAIADTLRSTLRDYDLAGRFGGEEFSLLLPQTRAADAFRIAERVRADVAALSIIAPGSAGGQRVQMTVSVGVAALDSGSSRGLSGLVAMADAALYRAKASGRDQVQMISTTRGLSAACGPGQGTQGRGPGDRPDEPSLFRRAQET